MKLLFLHGAPASGKFTVAKEILKLVQGELADSHRSIDIARSSFDFGTEEFWKFVKEIRSHELQAALKNKIPLLIMTRCYSEPQDYEAFQKTEKNILDHGGILLPVYLRCSLGSLQKRIANTDRIERQKISSVSGLNNFLEQWNIAPVPRPNCLTVDSDLQHPVKTAKKIINHFALRDESR